MLLKKLTHVHKLYEAEVTIFNKMCGYLMI